MAKTYSTPFINSISALTESNKEKWRRSGSRCFLYSPNNPAISICKYLNEHRENCISISLIDLNGVTTSEVIANEITSNVMYQECLELFSRIENISQMNANEALFQSMVTTYNLPK